MKRAIDHALNQKVIISRILTTIILSLGVFSQAFSLSEQIDTPSSSEQIDTPLKLQIIVRPTTVCSGKAITIRAVLTNTSSGKVAVDPNLVGSRATFEGFSTPASGIVKGETLTILGDQFLEEESKNNYIILEPGKSWKGTRKFILDEKLSLSAGTVTVKIDYRQFRESSVQDINLFVGTVTSNRSKFKIISCRKRRR